MASEEWVAELHAMVPDPDPLIEGSGRAGHCIMMYLGDRQRVETVVYNETKSPLRLRWTVDHDAHVPTITIRVVE